MKCRDMLGIGGVAREGDVKSGCGGIRNRWLGAVGGFGKEQVEVEVGLGTGRRDETPGRRGMCLPGGI